MTANEIALSIFGAMQLVSSGFIFILWRRERLRTEKWYRNWELAFQENTILREKLGIEEMRARI
jgi:hypothetical protein